MDIIILQMASAIAVLGAASFDDPVKRIAAGSVAMSGLGDAISWTTENIQESVSITPIAN